MTERNEHRQLNVRLYPKMEALKELSRLHRLVVDDAAAAAQPTILTHPVFNLNVDLRRLSAQQLSALESRLDDLESFFKNVTADTPNTKAIEGNIIDVSEASDQNPDTTPSRNS